MNGFVCSSIFNLHVLKRDDLSPIDNLILPLNIFFFFGFSDDFIFQAECYHYVFDAAIDLYPLGLDYSTRNHGPIPKSRGVFGGHQNADMSVKAGSLTSHNDKEQQRVSS